MLPQDVVERFTLAAGRTVPALSLYLDVASDLRILGHESRIESVPIAANLRHHDVEPVFMRDTLAAGLGEFPYRDELRQLWSWPWYWKRGAAPLRPAESPRLRLYGGLGQRNRARPRPH